MAERTLGLGEDQAMSESRLGRASVVSLFIGLAAAVGGGLPAAAQAPPRSEAITLAVRSMEHAAGARVETTHSSATGLATFMSATAPIPLGSAAGAPGEARAREFLAAHGAAFGVAD